MSARIMAHLVACYPDRAASIAVAHGLIEGGASYLELQFPFSDPTADGPDIQAACAVALASGFTVEEGFSVLREIAGLTPVPVFVMTYANLAFTRGIPRFLKECKEAGARGVIAPDLPPDYDEGLFEAARSLDLAAVPVVSPSASEDRLRRTERLDPEYVYATLRAGTTGAATRLDDGAISFLKRVRAMGSGATKVLGGFGVSGPAQVQAVAPHVHAVVVGSALVREIAQAGNPHEAVRRKMEELLSAVPGPSPTRP